MDIRCDNGITLSYCLFFGICITAPVGVQDYACVGDQDYIPENIQDYVGVPDYVPVGVVYKAPRDERKQYRCGPAACLVVVLWCCRLLCVRQGWEVRMDPTTRQQYFVNHRTRTTTWAGTTAITAITAVRSCAAGESGRRG